MLVTADDHHRIAAPSIRNRLLESRALFEMGAYAAAAPWLRRLRRGDHHPVLVLPGFTASDRSTVPLRSILAAQGYWTHGWGLGPNFGPTDRVLDGIRERVTTLYERSNRPISIVGWSLGGIYARGLAREFPDAVRGVITLGSPFRMTDADRSSVSLLVDRLTPQFSADIMLHGMNEALKPALQMPSTAIYTRTDGVVRWHTCIDTETANHENIEVRGSHSGLGWNSAVLYAVLDRLSQPQEDWRRFSAPLLLRHWYPRPSSFREAAAVALRENAG